MPGLTIERPKMTRTMYQALKKHIMKEREKKKQEQQEDAMMERRRKEKELRKKKEEENSLTLEQTKEQIQKLEEKLEGFKQEKHELFSQLKKVLNQEEEARKRAQMKEQNELLSLQQSAPYVIQGASHPMLHMSGRPTLYKPAQQMMTQQSLKRGRSPSPTPSSMYQSYEKYPSTYTTSSTKPQHGGIHPHYTQDYKPTSYPQGESVTYGTPDSTSYPQPSTIHLSNQSQASKYTPSGQSAFQHYPNYASQQKHQMSDPFTPGYHMQRVPQVTCQAMVGAISLQQQLDHANQKSGFSEEKYKAHHVRTVMPTMTAQQPTMMAQQLSIQQQQQQAKGAIGGYPARTQAPPTSSYQPTPSQGSYPGQSNAPSRPHAYPGQQPGRYY
ncbi:G protein pathway suppressor 2-like [Liolophura sinensis]|uniref:G protein pathway suppressor 2-like n=1 Tax=Liolophura sinensis TaxID=3198878 RepID=UPI0031596790